MSFSESEYKAPPKADSGGDMGGGGSRGGKQQGNNSSRMLGLGVIIFGAIILMIPSKGQKGGNTGNIKEDRKYYDRNITKMISETDYEIYVLKRSIDGQDYAIRNKRKTIESMQNKMAADEYYRASAELQSLVEKQGVMEEKLNGWMAYRSKLDEAKAEADLSMNRDQK